MRSGLGSGASLSSFSFWNLVMSSCLGRVACEYVTWYDDSQKVVLPANVFCWWLPLWLFSSNMYLWSSNLLRFVLWLLVGESKASGEKAAWPKGVGSVSSEHQLSNMWCYSCWRGSASLGMQEESTNNQFTVRHLEIEVLYLVVIWEAVDLLVNHGNAQYLLHQACLPLWEGVPVLLTLNLPFNLNCFRVRALLRTLKCHCSGVLITILPPVLFLILVGLLMLARISVVHSWRPSCFQFFWFL